MWLLVQLGRPIALALLVLSVSGSLPAAAQSTPEQAIQDIIQRGNIAQVLALANRDPTLLGDGSLGSYTQHPDRRARAPTPPESPAPPPPEVQPGSGTSRNWSGYAARGGTFTSVSATWTIPTIPLDGPFGSDAAWVGIGGIRARDLIQAGTQQSASGASSVTYQAWIEMLPEAAQDRKST